MTVLIDNFMKRVQQILSDNFCFRGQQLWNNKDWGLFQSNHSQQLLVPGGMCNKCEDEEASKDCPHVQNTDAGEETKLEPSCLTISVYSAVIIALVCIFLVVGRDYIKYVLMSLEDINLGISFLVFILLFTVVSFPMTWGYILLNIAAGYLYGLLLGGLIIILCALFGLLIAHIVIRHFLSNFVMSRLANKSIRAIMKVVESNHGLKVVFIARLTPIPFGLQNALFAVSNISTARYMAASTLGMLPTQGMHAYIGSTLRSMEEVISNSSSSTTAYIIFGAQLLAAVILLLFVVRRAKTELDRAVKELESDDSDQSQLLEEDTYDRLEKGNEMDKTTRNGGPPTIVDFPTHKRNGSKTDLILV